MYIYRTIDQCRRRRLTHAMPRLKNKEKYQHPPTKPIREKKQKKEERNRTWKKNKKTPHRQNKRKNTRKHEHFNFVHTKQEVM